MSVNRVDTIYKKMCIGYISKPRLSTNDLTSKHNLRDPCNQPDLNTEVRLAWKVLNHQIFKVNTFYLFLMYFFFLHLYFYMWMFYLSGMFAQHVFLVPVDVRREYQIPGTAAAASHCMGAKNWTWVLSNCIQCSHSMSHLCSAPKSPSLKKIPCNYFSTK